MPRLLLIVVLVVAVAWLGFRPSAPSTRTATPVKPPPSSPPPTPSPTQPRTARPAQDPDAAPNGRVAGPSVHSPGAVLAPAWDLAVGGRAGGLDPVAGDERYLVFLRNWAGWTLAGAARPGPDGTAQALGGRAPARHRLRGGGDPGGRRRHQHPHGQPVLQWFDASLGPPRARRFDFALGV